MSQQQFQKFIKKKKNSVVKEELRQEKKKVTKERKAFFEKQREEKYAKAAVKFAPSSKDKDVKMRGYGTQADTKKLEPATGLQPRPVSIEKPGSAKNEMPLNKFLAHCGVSSRREAVEIIKAGKVKVNNTVILEPSHKVTGTEDIKFNGKKIFVTKNLVYILLNKPKDYITTTEDPQGRKTVLELTRSATTERIYPIGRLDRNTSGVLLLTNDGELTQKLSHPSYQVKKIYEVRLDRPLTKPDFEKISRGLTLEDGFIQPDALGYADPKDKKVIGIEIHSGKNRIVRRIFESLHYDVKGLDRVMYANLTKKNVDRGKWRFLSEKEIRQLKFINKKQSMPPAKPGQEKQAAGND